MKIQSDTVRTNVDKSLQSLETFFMKIETDHQITRILMNRIQSNREDIGRYAYVLAKMKKRNDTIVRDCFIEGMICEKLRWNINREIENKQKMSFLEAR